MKTCFQFETMNVLQHGQNVWKQFYELYSHLKCGESLELEWRVPDWVYKLDLDKLLPIDKIEEYLTYHDCGKPFCRTVDSEGKQHFPNHANVSCQTYLRYSDDFQVARLIRMDMDIHTLASEDIESFSRRPEATTLLLAALAEIHSNCRMFGGIDSTSFKIKWKKINRIGKKLGEIWET